MLSITNLNSTKTINYNEDKIIAISGILSEKMKKVPVYLVDEDTMDKLYPDEKRKLFNEECLKEFIKEDRIDKENLENVFEKCSKKIISKSVGVGLYLRNIEKWLYDKFNNLKEPAIFICPERCIDWGNRLNIPADFVFTKVLLHEYAHAHLDVGGNSNYYDTPWGKVIEESLANYIAYTRFESTEDKANVTKLILDQPLEYRCSLALAFIEESKFIPLIRRYCFWESIVEYLFNFYGKHGIIPYIFCFNLDRIWKEYKKHSDEDLKLIFMTLALDLMKMLI